MCFRESSPGLSPPPEALSEAPLGIASHLQAAGTGCQWEEWTPVSLPAMYCELYSFFGDSLAVRFSTGPALGSAPAPAPVQPSDARKESGSGAGSMESTRKMPQLTANMNLSPRPDGSPRTETVPPTLGATASGRSLARSSSSSAVPRSRSSSRPGRSASQSRDIFPKARFLPSQVGPPAFTFLIGGRQMGRRCQGRRFQTSFTPTPSVSSLPPRAYAHKLPVIGRVSKPVRRWTCSHYSLYLPL